MSARRAARAAKYKGSKKKAPSWKCNWCHMSETRNQRPGPDGPKTLCDKCYHRHRNGETGPRVADWKCDWCGADDAAPPPSGLQREQAQQKLLAKVKHERDEAQDRNECIVCMERPRAVVFQPCNHCVVCATCATDKCPFCNGAVADRITIANSS